MRLPPVTNAPTIVKCMHHMTLLILGTETANFEGLGSYPTVI